MKKIVYTGAFRFPNGDAAAPRVLNNAKILRELGFNVFFVSFGGKPRSEDKNIDGNYYYQGFRYINTEDIDVKQTNPLKRIYRFIFSGKKAIKIINSIISDTDIVIGYQPSSYFTQKMMKICNKKNKQFISDLTEWYDPNEFPGGIFAPPSWLNEWNMRFTQRKVKNKIVISSFLNRYYTSSNNIVLPPLVDVNDDKWQNENEILPSYEGLRVVYAGTPGRKDLLDVMIKAVLLSIKRGLKIQFIIVGVKAEDISTYENYNEIIQFPNNIQFIGKVPQNVVPLYYKSSDFSIIVRENSRKSKAGFPTKFVESMMSGCPVIVNITSDLSAYINDNENGIVLKDFSLDSLTEVLENATRLSSNDIVKMKKQALQTGRKYFYFRNYTESMNEFLKRCYS